MRNMTLILGMSKPEGIYMSADYRVTRYPDGKLVDDASVKFLSITYPPHETGAKALLGYSGLAILPDGTPTGRWIRETLRGESELPDVSMAHLNARLDRDIAPLRLPLQITVLALQGERRYFGGFSNVRDVQSPFGYQMRELAEPFAFAHGSGTASAMRDAHRVLIVEQLKVRPRSPKNHMGLLAAVNRRVAATEPTVSPFCHVTYVNGDETTSPMSRTYTEPGEKPLPFEMPHLLFGIDLNGLMSGFQEKSAAFFRGEPFDDTPMDTDAVNESLRRRP
jgi:hypothetical protein